MRGMDEKPTCAEAAPMHVFTFGKPICQCGAKNAGPDLDRAEAAYNAHRQRIANLAAKMIAALDPEERLSAATLVKMRHEQFLDDLVACADAFATLSGVERGET